jgi:hypothetical protein
MLELMELSNDNIIVPALTDSAIKEEADTKLFRRIAGLTVSETGALSFPLRLHALLEDADTKGFSHIVSWQPDGKSFKVHKPEQFETGTMRSYFNQTKYKSFQRQVNLYGFRRIRHGPTKGSYYHKMFLRNQGTLSHVMARSKIHGNVTCDSTKSSAKTLTTENKKPMAIETTDNMLPLDLMESISSELCERAKEMADRILESEIDLFNQFFEAGDQMNLHSFESEMETDTFFQFLLEESPFTSSDTDDSDTESNPFTEASAPCIEPKNEEADSSVDLESSKDSERAFPWGLYTMLEGAKNEGFEDIVSWDIDGKSFNVHKHDEFVQKIMPLYFDQTKYESFRRQLNLYGFKRVHQKLRGAYFHPYFMNGNRNLCQQVTRRTANER